MLRDGRWRWGTYTQERRDRIMAHAERKFPKTKPEFMKGSIVRYFDTEPWGAARIERVLPAVEEPGKPDKEAERAEFREMLKTAREKERATYGV